LTDFEKRVDDILRAYIVEDGQAGDKPSRRLQARETARAAIMALVTPALREADRLRAINDEDGLRDPDLHLVGGKPVSFFEAAGAAPRQFVPPGERPLPDNVCRDCENAPCHCGWVQDEA